MKSLVTLMEGREVMPTAAKSLLEVVVVIVVSGAGDVKNSLVGEVAIEDILRCVAEGLEEMMLVSCDIAEDMVCINTSKHSGNAQSCNCAHV